MVRKLWTKLHVDILPSPLRMATRAGGGGRQVQIKDVLSLNIFVTYLIFIK